MAKAKFDPNAVTVLLTEIAVVCGGSDEVCGYWIRKVGARVVEDWQGRPGLSLADARAVVEAFRTSKDEHSTAFEAFQADIRNHKEQVRQAREEELRKKREAVTQANSDARRRWAERALKQREAEFAAEAAAEAARRGPSFEQWRLTHGGTP